MPRPSRWYCGHCAKGPMTIGIDEYCCWCHRQRDAYSTSDTREMSRSSCVEASSSAHEVVDNPPSGGALAPPLETFCSFNHALESHHQGGFDGPAAVYQSASAPAQMTPLTFGGKTYWYCCQCHDGPQSIAINGACQQCGHPYCSYCTFK